MIVPENPLIKRNIIKCILSIELIFFVLYMIFLFFLNVQVLESFFMFVKNQNGMSQKLRFLSSSITFVS